MAAAPALSVSGVSKRYGPVIACDAVDLTVNRGEIHGLLGENGAGKTTLMKILLGLVQRDAGTIAVHGVTTEITSPQQAVTLGLGMVHQHFSLIEPLTVWENISLGDVGRIDRTAICAQVDEVAARYRLPIDPTARVSTLSPGQRQRVELIKCLRRDPSVLILDEPTSVLTQAESAELFSVLRRVVKSEDRAVILISHKLSEVISATDRVTLLRHGRVVHQGVTATTTVSELARRMVGREVSLSVDGAALGVLPVGRPDSVPVAAAAPSTPDPAVAPALRLRRLSFEGGVGLGPIDLDVAPGEIVGLYGVEGNGQSLLDAILSGLAVPSAGTIEIGGRVIDLRRPGALTRGGLGIIPEDRYRSGVVLDLSVAENLMLKSLGEVSGRAFVSRAKLNRRARQLIKDFAIATPSPDTPLRRLSGGNQQRVVLARELSSRPRVLVAAQPTHGLDVGATAQMYQRLRMVAADGVGVLLVTTELEEVLTLASRIAVLSRGKITGLVPVEEASPERLGLLVGGMAG
ncbi:MAG TPA: ABC transporter ATP-binding protein [Kineosporiaceae bacterium]|nr:ABC transporter ATP-binding protein [Kineosporiaceae bacterium]